MTTRRLEFSSTDAVASARRRDRYILCPACGADAPRYLFHRKGARFVTCRVCDLVYADPVDPSERGYFDIAAMGQHDDPLDLDHAVGDFGEAISKVCAFYERRRGHPPRRVVVIGRVHPAYAAVTIHGTELELVDPNEHTDSALVTKPLLDTVGPRLVGADIVLLHEFLEGVHDPLRVLDGLAAGLDRDALVAIAFANMASVGSRLLRRRWRSFFDKKIAFYNGQNLERLLWRAGFTRLDNEHLHTRYSLGYLAARLELPGAPGAFLSNSGVRRFSATVATGREVIVFEPTDRETRELLTVIVPVYNEAAYVRDVLEALLAKELPIDRDVVIVESNSTDGSRDIVRDFEGRPGVRVILQDDARGKGHAVREGLAAARGSIVLIQDADFEYDLDDYDALLEPIIARQTSFVLGSRSLGLDDWKVRQYSTSRVKGLLMNLAQVVFARTFNLLYQQRVTDINTMLKVFRRECIDGCHLVGDGFNFDIELVCKIVRNGYEPYEVPVNYVARGFDEGKKINFLLDAYPSYWQLFRWRVGAF